MTHYHYVVWIDHREARLFSFSKEDVERQTIKAPHAHGHIHHHAGSIGSGNAHAGSPYMQDVEKALRDCGEFLVIGPGTAKLELVRHIHSHAKDLDKKLVGVETADHPTEGQIVAYARQYFLAADRMNHSNAEVIAEG